MKSKIAMVVTVVTLTIATCMLMGCGKTLTGTWYGSAAIIEPDNYDASTTKLTLTQEGEDLQGQWEGIDFSGTVTSNKYIEMTAIDIVFSGEVVREPQLVCIEALIENNTEEFEWKKCLINVIKIGVKEQKALENK